MEKAPNGNFSADGELRFSSGNSGDNSSPHHADGTATSPSNSSALQRSLILFRVETEETH
jgi:hypothetical protein